MAKKDDQAGIDKRAERGFFNCEKVELLFENDPQDFNISGFGKVLKNDIKALHQSHIDTMNLQQLTDGHHYLIRKIGYNYELQEVFAPGRIYPQGHRKAGAPNPHMIYVEEEAGKREARIEKEKQEAKKKHAKKASDILKEEAKTDAKNIKESDEAAKKLKENLTK